MFIVGFVIGDYLFAFIMSAVPDNVQARAGGVIDGFQVRVKLALYFGVFCGLPVIIHQSYGFVRPALRLKEDGAFRMYLIGGFILLAGALTFTHITLPHLIKAFNSFVPQSRQVLIQADIKAYIDTILTIYLGFSIVFQVPLVVFLTIVQGFVEASVYTENRKWVVVVLLILCAMFSPPDIQSQFLLFVPLYTLFEVAILLGKLLGPKKQ